MSVPNSIKKEIAKDWINEFPNLLAYTQSKLYKIVGPFITGIEIFNQPRAEEYRPYFVIYGLWDKDLKECLKDPAVLQEMRTRKNLQFDIPYVKHQDCFEEVVKSTRDQVLLPFNSDVTLKMFNGLINSRFSLDFTVRSSHASQAGLYMYKLFAALYVNNARLIDAAFKEIKQASEKWEPQYFDWKYGNFETWYKSLEEKVNHRDEFLAQIQMNTEDDKLKKLNFSELVDL